jgi:hypothetical protein
MPITPRRIGLAVCLDAGSEDDLQAGKVYRVLADPKGSAAGCLRVIDESGEDYLYSAKRFLMLDLPEKSRRQLLKIASPQPA